MPTADATSQIIGGAIGLIGTLVAALGGQILGRQKTRAEVDKLNAEAEQIRAGVKQKEVEVEKARLELEKAKVEMALSRPSNLPQTSTIPDPKTPKGWFLAGSAPLDYEIGIDDQVFYSGKSSGYIKSRGVPRDFGTMMQVISADKYRDKRLKMEGYAKSKGVRGWAGFWMRVDGPSEVRRGFDNMQDRPIKGSTGWTKYRIVLDVPEDSVDIAFGVLLSSEGQVWVDEIDFDIAGDDISTTELKGKYPDQAINLNFEE
jgi:hypothetical protein